MNDKQINQTKAIICFIISALLLVISENLK